jgi:hypothetical protein
VGLQAAVVEPNTDIPQLQDLDLVAVSREMKTWSPLDGPGNSPSSLAMLVYQHLVIAAAGIGGLGFGLGAAAGLGGPW